jgi:hypothetical protein
VWKIYNIETGKILKAGFESEDAAKEWFDERIGDRGDLFEIDEMDQDEVDEWNEKLESEELEAPDKEEEYVVADEFPDDLDDDADDDHMSTIYEDDEDQE